MMADALLTEVERQKKYLDRLPEDYVFPLFNAKQALESQRQSGYRDTASASREIVDNAVEAGASRVDVVFDAAKNASGKKVVKAVAFIDDGSGMLPEMARYALSWGGGTHFDDPSYIGKFGFGLPNASINQTRRVEVYTRTDAAESFAKAYLDVNTFAEFGVQKIPEPETAELPGFVQRYAERNGIDLSHGTVVVWVEPDRLTYRTPAYLKEHLVDDFGVTYRYMLDSDTPDTPDTAVGALQLIVEGVRVQPVDPMFLLPGARLYLPPEEGGATLVEDVRIPVKYYRDPDTGERHLKRIEGEEDLVTESPEDVIGTIQVRIARFPFGFAVDKGRKRGETTDENRRFEIRKSRRGMSFVRVNRELQTVDDFPRTQTDVASGLGSWPLLQSYAYHWGVETKFGPELDEVFGITNDKQGVRPVEDFWRVLTQAQIDEFLRRENRWQSQQRKRKVPEPPKPDRPSAPERAAQFADVAAGERPRVPERVAQQVRQNLDTEAQRLVGAGASSIEEARAALEKETHRRRYRIDYFENEHGPFYEPEWFGSQVLVRVNRKHPFYEVFYGDLLELPGGARAKGALDLVLFALARAELSTDDEEMALWYEAQRKRRWSSFLETSLRSLAQQLEQPEEEEEPAADEAGQEGSAA